MSSELLRKEIFLEYPNDEPASVLLEKIKAEKEKLIEEKKLKKSKPLPPIKEEEIPFDISDNWVWCKLEQLRTPDREITYGIVKLGDKVNEGILTLHTSDVKLGKIISYNIRKVHPKISDNYKRTLLEGGEILYAIRGTLNSKRTLSKLRGITYKGLNLGHLREFLIPLPPLEEQVRIVNKIEQLLKLSDELEKEVKQNQHLTQQLLQSVLKEALEPKVN